ncbi:hypothetical protein JTB14_032417 [Gonioctena quinquepunctata]|nr:hypothetical protein JTB14_032417 [Gonioctena quinquepunctata]
MLGHPHWDIAVRLITLFESEQVSFVQVRSSFILRISKTKKSMAPERAVTSQEERISTPVMSVPASPVAGTPVQNARSPISILLAVAQSQSKSDDDLTNLNWLHERDLLKGMNISPSNNCTPVKDHSSNTSTDTSITNCDDDSESISGYLISDSTCPNQSTTAPRNKHPYDIPYDPSVHTDNKPPYSFSCLIFMAIEDSVEKALPVKEIYAWIVNHFPYFKNAPMGWKNSVRHNLSLNKCFQKVEKISAI